MSAQFGRCNFDGKPVNIHELDRVRAVLAPYGPDAEGSFCKDNAGVIYRAFHTTKESRLEVQPHVAPSGAVVTWDGRLDNREEIIGQLRGGLSASSTDLSIVATAYDRWGVDAFSKLIGDWAVSIWDASAHSLILAKDFVGTRHLYYSIDRHEVTWSTVLDPLVLFPGKTFALCEEYVAGWFSFFPAAHLTPYVGIHSVPPSSVVLLRSGKHTISKYWDFDPSKRIRYGTDGEYEEHFRVTFAKAVKRRLRSDSPVLAELSGGMDSSSIVCVADAVIGEGIAETPRLDTVSYYSDSEPNWNERPYFTKVEERRGRTGCHINVSSQEPFNFRPAGERFAATPSSGGSRPSESRKQFFDSMTSHGNRVVLSGVGGDEITGGVPTPIPELQDLLARARLRTLAHQLTIWALNKRRPWFHLLCDAAGSFFPPTAVDGPKHRPPATWLNHNFAKQHHAALQGYTHRLKLFGPLPSFQDNLGTLDALRRQLACSALPSEPTYDKRYPYLDRDLLEFVYAIPRQQLVRPGHRRSLMRRALAGIVPDEILNRKRKAYVVRSPIAALLSDKDCLAEVTHQMLSSSLRIVDEKQFLEAVQMARHGHEVPMVPLMRTLGIEVWLRQLVPFGILAGVHESDQSSQVSCAAAISAETTMYRGRR